MGEKTKIEWTESTWTPIRARDIETGKVGWFCTHASEGCRNCYAETMNARLGTGIEFKAQNRRKVEIFVDDKMLAKPLSWQRGRMIFVCSMTDLFGDFVTDEMIDRVFRVMAMSKRHTYQVLTKRPERARAYLTAEGVEARIRSAPGVWPLPNVWLGTSVEDQPNANERVPHLMLTPAAVRFLSIEPLLAPVDPTRISTMRFRGAEIANALTGELSGIFGDPAGYAGKIHWVIVGGESGSKARPMHPDWARFIRDQCSAWGTAFMMKQWGAWAPCGSNDGAWPVDTRTCIRLTPDGKRQEGGWPMQMVGKEAAGRVLDGEVHDGMPA